MVERKKLHLTLPEKCPDPSTDKTEAAPEQGMDVPDIGAPGKTFSLSPETISSKKDPERDSGDSLQEEVDVGAILRDTRLERGLELRDVAAELRIRHTYLQAIEDGRFSDLPGATYAGGFVRAYAEYLGLDRNNIIERFRTQAAGRSSKLELKFPEPAPETRVPGGAILLISILLAAVAYGGWYRLSMDGQEGIKAISDVPDRLIRLVWNEDEPIDEPFEEGETPTSAPPPQVAGEASRDEAFTEVPVRLESGVTTYYGAPTSEVSDLRDDSAAAGRSSLVTETSGEAQRESLAGDVDASNEAEDAAVSAAGPSSPVQAGGTPSPVQAGETPSPLQAGETSSPLQAGETPSPVQAGELSSPDQTGELSPLDSGEAAAPGVDDSDLPPLVEEEAGEPSSGSSLQEARTPMVYGDEFGDVRIVIKAMEDSWVQIRDADGGSLLTRILRAGDIFRVPDEYGLTLFTGNAGALEVTVDGVVAPSLGPLGAIRRDVVLDAYRLQNGTAVPP